MSALRARYLEQGLIIPSLEDHNPAGMYIIYRGVLQVCIYNIYI